MSESTQLVPLAEIERMAAAVAKSALFGCKTPDQAMALMLLAQSEGMHPMKAVQEFHIISGRPSRKAEAMLARFQQAGGSVKWITLNDAVAEAVFSHPQGGEATIRWSFEMASKITTKEDGQTIPLTSKKVWKEYPRAMLRSRCISEGVRTVYPGATGGLPTPEEIEALPDKDMGDAEIVPPRSKSEQAAAASATTGIATGATTGTKTSAKKPPAKAEAPAVNTEDAMAAQPISPGARSLLTKKLADAALTDAELCKALGVEKLEDVRNGQLNQALDFIKNPTGGQQ